MWRDLRDELATLTPARWRTHAALALITLGAVGAASVLLPRADLNVLLTLALGYEALVLIALTLVIGTAGLIVNGWRRAPVNIHLRRDVGWWAALTSLAHMIAAFTLHGSRTGGSLLGYFLVPGTLRPRADLFGVANSLGLIAVITALGLLLISTNAALRRLKGPRWKQLQRYNYLLAFLAFVHTLMFQQVSGRESLLGSPVALLALIVLAAQLLGVLIVNARTRRLRRDFT